MHFVIGGASGFLGTALRERLARDGNTVTRLVRGDAPGETASRWDPAKAQVDQAVIESADVVINVAGSSILRPWTPSVRDSIRSSRVASVSTLAAAVARSAHPPAMIVQSGTDWYGTGHGSEVVDESTPHQGDSPLLTQVVHEVEAATATAERSGARVCHLRTGVVTHRGSGAMKVMLPFFRLGIGGRVADGSMYFPVISLPDWIAAVLHLAGHESAGGPHNLTAPNPPTNAEFTAAMGATLHRPTVMFLPRPVLEKGFGEMANMLLNSLRVVPSRLLDEGFEFQDPTVEDVVRTGLS